MRRFLAVAAAGLLLAGCVDQQVRPEREDRVADPAPALARDHGPEDAPVDTPIEQLAQSGYGLAWTEDSVFRVVWDNPLRLSVMPNPGADEIPSDATIVWSRVRADGSLLSRSVGWALHVTDPELESQFVQVTAYAADGRALASLTRAIPVATSDVMERPCGEALADGMPRRSSGCPVASFAVPATASKLELTGSIVSSLRDGPRDTLQLFDAAGTLVQEGVPQYNLWTEWPRLEVTAFDGFDLNGNWTAKWSDADRWDAAVTMRWTVTSATEGLPTPTFPVVDLAVLPAMPILGVRVEATGAAELFFHQYTSFGVHFYVMVDPVGALAPDDVTFTFQVFDPNGTLLTDLDVTERHERSGIDQHFGVPGVYWVRAQAHRLGEVLAEEVRPMPVSVFSMMVEQDCWPGTVPEAALACAPVPFYVPQGTYNLWVELLAPCEAYGHAELRDAAGDLVDEADLVAVPTVTSCRGAYFSVADLSQHTVDGPWTATWSPPRPDTRLSLRVLSLDVSAKGAVPPSFAT